jgi:hypothetical protein
MIGDDLGRYIKEAKLAIQIGANKLEDPAERARWTGEQLTLLSAVVVSTDKVNQSIKSLTDTNNTLIKDMKEAYLAASDMQADIVNKQLNAAKMLNKHAELVVASGRGTLATYNMLESAAINLNQNTQLDEVKEFLNSVDKWYDSVMEEGSILQEVMQEFGLILEEGSDAWEVVAKQTNELIKSLRVTDAPISSFNKLTQLRGEVSSGPGGIRTTEELSEYTNKVQEFLKMGQQVYQKPSKEYAALFAEAMRMLEEAEEQAIGLQMEAKAQEDAFKAKQEAYSTQYIQLLGSVESTLSFTLANTLEKIASSVKDLPDFAVQLKDSLVAALKDKSTLLYDSKVETVLALEKVKVSTDAAASATNTLAGNTTALTDAAVGAIGAVAENTNTLAAETKSGTESIAENTQQLAAGTSESVSTLAAETKSGIRTISADTSSALGSIGVDTTTSLGQVGAGTVSALDTIGVDTTGTLNAVGNNTSSALNTVSNNTTTSLGQVGAGTVSALGSIGNNTSSALNTVSNNTTTSLGQVGADTAATLGSIGNNTSSALNTVGHNTSSALNTFATENSRSVGILSNATYAVALASESGIRTISADTSSALGSIGVDTTGTLNAVGNNTSSALNTVSNNTATSLGQVGADTAAALDYIGSGTTTGISNAVGEVNGVGTAVKEMSSDPQSPFNLTKDRLQEIAAYYSTSGNSVPGLLGSIKESSIETSGSVGSTTHTTVTAIVALLGKFDTLSTAISASNALLTAQLEAKKSEDVEKKKAYIQTAAASTSFSPPDSSSLLSKVATEAGREYTNMLSTSLQTYVNTTLAQLADASGLGVTKEEIFKQQFGVDTQQEQIAIMAREFAEVYNRENAYAQAKAALPVNPSTLPGPAPTLTVSGGGLMDLRFGVDMGEFIKRGLDQLAYDNAVADLSRLGKEEDYKMKLRSGIDYVPYNDMPALLHKGERVLTSEESKAYSGMLDTVESIVRVSKVEELVSNTLNSLSSSVFDNYKLSDFMPHSSVESVSVMEVPEFNRSNYSGGPQQVDNSNITIAPVITINGKADDDIADKIVDVILDHLPVIKENLRYA